MTKNHKLLLADYIKDSTPLRLSLFATMINPLFDLKKQSKGLELLILDYKSDQSPARLRMIENYVLGSSIQTAKFKPSDLKESKQIKESKLKASKELSLRETMAEDLRKQLTGLIRSRSGLNVQLENQISDLRARLLPLETECGAYDTVPPEKSKLDIVFGLFGHWDDPASIAYELFHGTRTRIQIRTNQDVHQAVLDLITLSGQTMRQFHITSNEMAGGVKGSGHKPTWTLVDVLSGAGPADSNMVEMVDGKVVSNAGIMKNVPRPNLRPLGAPL